MNWMKQINNNQNRNQNQDGGDTDRDWSINRDDDCIEFNSNWLWIAAVAVAELIGLVGPVLATSTIDLAFFRFSREVTNSINPTDPLLHKKWQHKKTETKTKVDLYKAHWM